MLKIWGRATSSNVQLVMWAVNEIGIAHERIDAGGKFGIVDTPEFRRLNPNGLVPVIEDGDLTMFESAAIVRYLGAAYGTEQFWPADPLKRAAQDKWSEWIKTTFGPTFLTGVFWPMIAVKPERRDETALAAAVGRLKTFAGMLDARLAEGDYLGGDAPCFADMVVGAPLYRYFDLDIPRAETPHLRAYYDRLAARPAYAEHVMISYDSLRAK